MTPALTDADRATIKSIIDGNVSVGRGYAEDIAIHFLAAGRAAERERCAKVCDEQPYVMYGDKRMPLRDTLTPWQLAAAIRADDPPPE